MFDTEVGPSNGMPIKTAAAVTSAIQIFKSHGQNCATSAAIAQAAGCIFHPPTVSWVPRRCSRVMADEFAAKNFTYYGDREGHEVLTADQLVCKNGINAKSEAAENVWWATQAEHATHCLFLFMRFHAEVTEILEGNDGNTVDLRLDTKLRDI